MQLRIRSERELAEREVSPTQLTRRDVARQHIDTAIDLTFSRGSLASVHLLASAAHQILSDVMKKSDIAGTSSKIESRIRPEHISEWRTSIRRPYNFLKHADKDPDDIISLKPDLVWMTLFSDVLDFWRLYGYISFEMSFFFIWFFRRKPNLFKPESFLDILKNAEFFGQYNSLSCAAEVFQDLTQRGARANYNSKLPK